MSDNGAPSSPQPPPAYSTTPPPANQQPTQYNQYQPYPGQQAVIVGAPQYGQAPVYPPTVTPVIVGQPMTARVSINNSGKYKNNT